MRRHVLTLPQALAVAAAIDTVLKRQEARPSHGRMSPDTMAKLGEIRVRLEHHQHDLEGPIRDAGASFAVRE